MVDSVGTCVKAHTALCCSALRAAPALAQQRVRSNNPITSPVVDRHVMKETFKVVPPPIRVLLDTKKTVKPPAQPKLSGSASQTFPRCRRIPLLHNPDAVAPLLPLSRRVSNSRPKASVRQSPKPPLLLGLSLPRSFSVEWQIKSVTTLSAGDCWGSRTHGATTPGQPESSAKDFSGHGPTAFPLYVLPPDPARSLRRSVPFFFFFSSKGFWSLHWAGCSSPVPSRFPNGTRTSPA